MIIENEVLKTIDEQVRDITEFQMTDVDNKLTKVATNEKTLGVIHDDFIRKLWSAGVMFERLSNGAEIAAQTATTSEIRDKWQQSKFELSLRASLCERIFWYEARKAMDFWGDKFGIRAGWMMVTYEHKLPRGIEAIIEGIMGKSE